MDYKDNKGKPLSTFLHPPRWTCIHATCAILQQIHTSSGYRVSVKKIPCIYLYLTILQSIKTISTPFWRRTLHKFMTQPKAMTHAHRHSRDICVQANYQLLTLRLLSKLNVLIDSWDIAQNSQTKFVTRGANA